MHNNTTYISHIHHIPYISHKHLIPYISHIYLHLVYSLYNLYKITLNTSLTYPSPRTYLIYT